MGEGLGLVVKVIRRTRIIGEFLRQERRVLARRIAVDRRNRFNVREDINDALLPGVEAHCVIQGRLNRRSVFAFRGPEVNSKIVAEFRIRLENGSKLSRATRRDGDLQS